MNLTATIYAIYLTNISKIFFKMLFYEELYLGSLFRINFDSDRDLGTFELWVSAFRVIYQGIKGIF